jgi:hypothetical protein
MNNTTFAQPLADLIFTGLAPEIPEDLYMLIKKVSTLDLLCRKPVNTILYRPSLFASILSGTEKIRTPSSVSFLSSPEFTVSPDITRPSVSCHQPGDMRVLLPVLWSHRYGNGLDIVALWHGVRVWSVYIKA